MIANKEYPWQHFFPILSNQLLNPTPECAVSNIPPTFTSGQTKLIPEPVNTLKLLPQSLQP